MTTPEIAYAEIEKLIQKFKSTSSRDRRAMNEHATRQGYIIPFFRALGWNFDNLDEVFPEDKVSRGFVDFSFRIGNVPRFFLETKRVEEDLTDPQWVRQAIDYAWTKSVTWALLSDFEGLIVFNAEAKTENPFQARFLDFDVDTYLSKFDQLWWLSREQTALGRLDTEADKFGRINKRQRVSQELFADLKKWRELLFNDIKLHNPIFPPDDIDNAILHLLNRLIFIRTAEDRQVEPIRLRALVRELEDRKLFKNWGAELSKLFRKMDETYNSELFAPHFSDGLEFTPSELKKVIEGLYQKHYILYNFNALEADVLGTVYEQYLGAVLTDKPNEEIKPKKGAKQTPLIPEGMTVQERRAKRKSQGIYYTPSFVTKYIVQQTVGKYLQENGYNPSKPPQILDMACGSGSFLIEAFDVVDEFVAKQKGHARKGEMDFHDRLRQLEVLENCIFGVDKDKQALEVARLNLLLRALHSPDKLPLLKNFHLGDSLQPDTWEIGFPQIMKNGGFDIIIGNPPYVRQETLGAEFKEFAKRQFVTFASAADLYIYFIEQAHKLLKPNGYFGMIVSNKWMRSKYGKALREFLTRESELMEIIDFDGLPVFGDVLAYPVIIITRRRFTQKHNIQVATIKNLDFISLSEEVNNTGTSYQGFQFSNDNWNLTGNDSQSLLSKVLAIGEPLGRFVNNQIYRGLLTGLNEAFVVEQPAYKKIISSDKKAQKLIKPFLMGRDVHDYFSDTSTKYLICIPRGFTNSEKEDHQNAWVWFKNSYPSIAAHLSPFEEKAKKRLDKGDYWWELRACDYYDKFALPKLIAPAIVQHATFTFDPDGFYSNDKTSIIVSDSLYVLGILNSRISDFVLKQIASTKQGGYFEQKPMYISRLPIRRIDFSNPAEKSAHEVIIKLVEQMLALQKEQQLLNPGSHFDEIRNVERNIAHVDEEIDKHVYQLYGLTDEDIKIVEGNSKG